MSLKLQNSWGKNMPAILAHCAEIINDHFNFNFNCHSLIC